MSSFWFYEKEFFLLSFPLLPCHPKPFGSHPKRWSASQVLLDSLLAATKPSNNLDIGRKGSKNLKVSCQIFGFLKRNFFGQKNLYLRSSRKKWLDKIMNVDVIIDKIGKK